MGDVRQEIALYNKSTIEILYRIILGGGIMRRVVVDMQNALFADAISSALKNFDSDFSVYQSELRSKQPRCVSIYRRMF